jgi:uncharacterized protein
VSLPQEPVPAATEKPVILTGFWKWFYILLGFLLLGVAYLGWILPGLPWTPFVVLASLCFGRSSPRLERWLLNNRYFGQNLRDFKKYRGVRRKIKQRATIMIVIVVSISVATLILTDRAWYTWAMIPPLAFVGVMYLWFCLRTLPDDLPPPPTSS